MYKRKAATLAGAEEEMVLPLPGYFLTARHESHSLFTYLVVMLLLTASEVA